MAEEKRLSSRRIYEGRAINLRVDTVEKPGGQQTTRDIVEHADCIAVIPLDDEDNILLVRQYRTPVGKKLLEIPAGGIEPGEDPETAVRREMQEETGYYPQKVERLGGYYSAPGYSTEYLYLFLATGLKASKLFAEDTDEIEVVRVPAGEIRNMILCGDIDDSKSVAGLFTYLEKRKAQGC
ncbi:MAG: NUDIX hydrolase [Dehalococcoidales bacterium]|nr:NUDIX hydrolase [Dehalococcoidales bacterium]